MHPPQPVRDVLARIFARGPGAVFLALALTVLLAGCSGQTLQGALRPQQAAPGPAAPAQTQLQGQQPAQPGVPGAQRIDLPPVAATEYRVAFLAPLTGADADIGRDLLDAAQLSIAALAEADFALMPYDTAQPGGARAAMEAALNDGAQLVLGPLLAADVQVAAPLARARGVPVISFSNTPEVAGDGVYLMGIVPRQQVIRVVRQAFSRGVTRFAALAPSNAYGTNMVQALAAATAEVGATVTHVEYYDPAGDPVPAIKKIANYDQRVAQLQAQRAELRDRGDDLARQALRRLENRDTYGDVDFGALLLPAAGAELQKIAALLPYYDIDPGKVRMLGTWQWDQDGIGAEPALVGGWFAGPPREQRVAFEDEFRQTFKRRPHRLASLAYDATALAAVLASQTGPVPDRRQAFFRAKLTSVNGFAGVDGIFRLLPSGETERGLAVIEVQRNAFRILSPAPQSFQAAVN